MSAAGGSDPDELEARVAAILAREPTEPPAASLVLAIRCLDLTALDGEETAEEAERLAARAIRPDPSDPGVPSVAAVCVTPRLVPLVAPLLAGSGVRVASVAGAFPTGDAPLDDRLAEIRTVVADGADEVDVVMNRAAFLEGDPERAAAELRASRDVASPARMKAILEVGALGSPDRIRAATLLAIEAGADFVKTSTGKVGAGATPSAALCVMEVVREHAGVTGRRVGVKVSGGIRTADQAASYLALVTAALGRDWLVPERFRFGASALLDDLLGRLRSVRTAPDMP